MPSLQLRALKRSVYELRRHFLPRVFRPLGDYSRPTRVQAHTRAFIVLVHAEIESYLEDWSQEVTVACETKWDTASRISKPLSCLLSASNQCLQLPTNQLEIQQQEMTARVHDVVKLVIKSHKKTIKKNNGIKEVNLLSLFAPLGLPSMALGSTLIPNLNSYGSLRGDLVHKSQKAVARTLDAETEFNKALSLITDIEDLDQWLRDCRRGM